jgi:hypothetical protein
MEGEGDFYPYRTLGLSKGASVEEVEAKYDESMMCCSTRTELIPALTL